MKLKHTIIFMLLIALLFVLSNVVKMPEQEEQGEEKEAQAGLANPAAVYCVGKGGQIIIINTEQGQAGYCGLPDGRICEEWKFFYTEGAACIPLSDSSVLYSENDCKSECLAEGYDEGQCIWPREAEPEYLSLGPCLIRQSSHCGNIAQCKCYCY